VKALIRDRDTDPGTHRMLEGISVGSAHRGATRSVPSRLVRMAGSIASRTISQARCSGIELQTRSALSNHVVAIRVPSVEKAMRRSDVGWGY